MRMNQKAKLNWIQAELLKVIKRISHNYFQLNYLTKSNEPSETVKLKFARLSFSSRKCLLEVVF